MVLGVLVKPLRGEHGLDHMFKDVGVQFLVGDILRVLGADDDGVDAGRLAVLIVLDRDLALAVGTKVRQFAAFADFSQLAGELVGEGDGGRHQFGSLVGCVAKHHALVAGAAGIYALGDVTGLLVDGGNDRAGIGVKPVDRIVVADGGHNAAYQSLEIDVGLGGDFAGDDNQAGSRQGFCGDAAVGVLLQACRRG